MKKRFILISLCLSMFLSLSSNHRQIFANEQASATVSHTKEEFRSRLTIKEDNKVVYSGQVNSEVDSNGSQVVLDYANLKKYTVDRFYSYDNAKIRVDGKSIALEDGKLRLDKTAKEISIQLAKRSDLWNKVNLIYPQEIDKVKREIDVKTYSSFEDFRLNNQAILNKLPSPKENYSFSHYDVNGNNLATYNGIITSDLNIKGIYNTKIIFKTYNDKLDDYEFKTGEKIDVNLARYDRNDYDTVSYDIINNASSKLVKNISREELENMVVEDSITVIPKYEPKKYKVMVRQDNYNKRFGKIDESLENYDIEWQANMPLSGLLSELRSKIKPNDGYELQFRINKKEVDPGQFLQEETLLEIYFKKKEGSWVNVKFTGEGIDKFLSDGQEVLAGNRIDTINLPTSQGSNKEFVGWTANREYKYQIKNKTILKEKDSVIKTVDLPHVVATKDQNLVFKAKYLENYKVRLTSNGLGNVLLTNSDNVFNVKEGTLIKNSIGNKKLLMLPNAHFQFSHLTADHAVMIRNESGAVKLVAAGEKFSQQDFYNIVGYRDLNIKSHFSLYKGELSLDNSLISNDDSNLLSLEFDKNYNSTLEDALGPLNYLR
ncbi:MULTISPECIES: hypothetical protein [unclassified Gemella]|uniref:hypothetical protein n=1 Tax=unclassified Gemella TaxID=2624949 RepID=UPI0010742CFC|nr:MULTISPECIES: hypothetical protein [unclassified Gemella]MBF0709841.1 hypothetical protein [Gemella sp. GL1.1]MBF0746854.1 hypothetical protein [Gemella sp. 19428wG2_WT2a]NYS27185.1 hypothetical protein [Gemella sp. GL1]TFU59577.1 hypothetical protein E4T67_04205 [Gemella sp. WT2a]